ncbi:hypothetical protein PPROV_000405100 [Pycnococcus provasolii]|uniref:Uncharacterized protein n=1 Tax=Pycnococcus provasolii TaxID=41880 RepID=A0A830HJ33_9CHLO|nr:hypothetical protein PPROV_000405100 [Pycnococcus provasolii]
MATAISPSKQARFDGAVTKAVAEIDKIKATLATRVDAFRQDVPPASAETEMDARAGSRRSRRATWCGVDWRWALLPLFAIFLAAETSSGKRHVDNDPWRYPSRFVTHWRERLNGAKYYLIDIVMGIAWAGHRDITEVLDAMRTTTNSTAADAARAVRLSGSLPDIFGAAQKFCTGLAGLHTGGKFFFSTCGSNCQPGN